MNDTAKQLTPIDAFRGTVDRLGDEFCKALPKHIPVEKFQRIVMSAVGANNDLLFADRTSLLAACMKSAQDGLLLDGRDAALVVFKAKQKDGSYAQMVQYMPMIGGILKKIRQSGELESITSEVVYQNDEFDRWMDEDGEHFKHRPSYGENRGDVILVYAFARTKDGGKYLEVMDRADVERVRQVSRAKDNGPWVQWWNEMARKTVTRRLAKRLPSSTDIERMWENDNETYDLTPQPVTVTQGEKPTRPTRLQQIVSDKAQAAMPESEPMKVENSEPQGEDEPF